MRPCVIMWIAALAAPLIPGSLALADMAPKAATAAFEKRFEEMDANGDGRIDRVEYVKHEIKKANERFDVSDENRDGFITREEAERATTQKQEQLRKQMKEWQQEQEEGRLQRQP